MASRHRADRGMGSGGVAQLGERLVCNQEAIGSIPFTSTILRSKSEEALPDRRWMATL